MFDDFDTRDEEDFGFAEPMAAEPEGLLPPREATECFGHQNVETALLDMINASAVPHAMIFNGTVGIGKSTMAFRLARYLLKHGITDESQDSLFGDASASADSLSIPFDDPTFSRVISGGHPDLLTIERQTDAKKGTKKSTVDVETARKVAPFLRMTSSDGGWRVVIIDDADTMNRNAQNAMLKILEEPPKNALLILITHRLGALIPTIRSRCRVLNFDPLDSDILSDLIIKEVGGTLGADQKQILTAMAQGSIGRAKEIIDANGIEMAEQVLTLLQSSPNLNWVDIHHLADQTGRAGQDAAFKMLERTFLWMVESIIYAQARNTSPITPFNQEAYAPILNSKNLNEWLVVLEKLQMHFNQIWHSNLDKRHGVLEAFKIISAD